MPFDFRTGRAACSVNTMSLARIGIIGCGHLAGFLCAGLQYRKWHGEIVVTSYHESTAKRFADNYAARIVASSQELIDQCDLILLSVRPDQYQKALQGLVWTQQSVLVSVLAGVPVASLQEHASPAVIIRAMPISSAAINQSPTPVYPAHPVAREFFNLLGSTIEIPDEQQFTVATVNAAAYGWIFALIDELEKANCEAGLSSDHARQLVSQTFTAAASVASGADGELSQVLSTLATPGGITAEGHALLQSRKSLDAWREAFQQIVQRLEGDNCSQ